MPMLELREIARMEEGRQAEGIAEVAAESRRIAGGTMARDVPGTWFNYAVGLGLHGPVSDVEVDQLIEFYSERGIEPRVELCPFADDSLIGHLAAAGFVTRLFEMTFYRELDRSIAVAPIHSPPAGLSIRAVDKANDAEVPKFVTVTTSGFMPDVSPIPQEFLDPGIKSVKHPQSVVAAAWLDGRMVGGGTIFRSDAAAHLAGLSVLPEYRRRGIQQALIAWRLNEAARLGCRIATVGSRPGHGTERNVRRMGFALAYTKVHLVRPGAGLEPIQG